MSFELKNISFAYNGKKLLSEISIGVNAGELHCLVGKNGAGKSTLLKIMTGDLSPHTGSLSLDGREIRSFSLEDLAKKRAVMLQETRVDSPFTVGEVCLLGRSPYHGGKESLEDHKITKKSLKLVDNWILKNKIIQNTSGGEKQRTHLARVLAQIWDKNGFSSKYLLLDEPLSSLDIQHQIQVLKILSLLTKKGLGVFIILHDLNLASAFATKISILKDGKILQTGVPKEVLNSKNLEEAYGIKVKTLYDPDLDQVLIHPYHQRKQKEKKMVKRRFSQEELKTNWETYKKENPRKRIRDAAHEMGVSEMELLATGLGESVIRLKENWKEIIAEVGCLGYVMALTRNEACVHERKGVYQNISENSGVGLVVGEDIDLRVFYHSWKYGFAVYDKKGHEVQKSLQFFDISGTAIHKIFLNDKSNHSEFIKIVDKFRWIGEAELETKLAASQKQDFPDSEIDRVSFLKEWSELQDTHDFFGLTRKFKVSRTQSLRLAEGSFTTKVDSGLVKKMLEEVSKSGLEIMVFVGNHGMIQIHTGKVSNFKILENWVNIMDPEFNLHLREDLIENVWIVRKPTKDGDVHSMEVFDKDGEMIVQFFGKRKPGISENKDWKALLEAIQ